MTAHATQAHPRTTRVTAVRAKKPTAPGSARPPSGSVRWTPPAPQRDPIRLAKADRTAGCWLKAVLPDRAERIPKPG